MALKEICFEQDASVASVKYVAAYMNIYPKKHDLIDCLCEIIVIIIIVQHNNNVMFYNYCHS